MSSRHLVFVLLVLLARPSVAPAGPIDISYHPRWDAFVYPGQHDAGPLDFALDASGNVSWMGRGSVALGVVRFGHSPGPQADDSYTAYVPFEVSVAVADQTTGESVRLALPGAAIDMWDYRAWDGRWMNTSHRLELGDSDSGNAAEVSAVLGHTRYTLAVRPEDDHQTGAYTLTATVTNPEPGTLIMAALGLAPLCLRARSRMKRNQPCE